MSSRVYFHSLYKTRDYSYSSSLESPTFHFGFKGVDYRTLTFLRKQNTATMTFDEVLVRRLILRVTVYEGRFIVVFRSGVEAQNTQPEPSHTQEKASFTFRIYSFPWQYTILRGFANLINII